MSTEDLNNLQLEELFNDACTAVASLASTLPSDDLLFFYAHYKQVTEGPCTSSRPSFYYFKAKQKWDAWHKLGQMSSEKAMQEYVSKLSRLHSSWQQDMPKSMYGAPTVSCHIKEVHTAGEKKTIYDHIREGNLEAVKTIPKDVLGFPDPNGLTVLHWASDLGHHDILNYLLSQSIPIDCTDDEGQTPLHYASACYNIECVRLLLEAGASTDIKDSDGMTPSNVAGSSQVRDYIDSFVNTNK